MTSVASPNSFSNDFEHCTFDLKFGDTEQDECLTQQSVDLFGRSQSPSDELLNSERDRKTQSRKRKMDKDGFVTPATPDIPKSSNQYGLPGHSDNDEQQEEMNCGDRAGESENPEEEFMQQQQKPKHDDVTANCVERDSSKASLCDTADELFEDLAQSTKMVIIQMAQSFRESEDYESICLDNVGKMLEEAIALENRLRHQKDLLQQRLFMIGRNLHEPDQ
ncbi:uncharacterized protein [Littorina saxatilis]|uniref:Uncharacterized protein n=1 Tax=Littorina saxatilis TaxID=31220 RepID=A0AAN9BT55_9CAEN